MLEHEDLLEKQRRNSKTMYSIHREKTILDMFLTVDENLLLLQNAYAQPFFQVLYPHIYHDGVVNMD